MPSIEPLTQVAHIAITYLAAASLLLPAVLAMRLLHRSWDHFDKKNPNPFSELPIRPPGESLRQAIGELSSALALQVIYLLFPVLLGAVTLLQASYEQLPLYWVITFAFCILWAAFWIPRISKTANDLSNYKLGFMGERIVGEALNQLMLDGYRVFHDLPFKDFNIDHVVVGASGVYVFETKARRKKLSDAGQKEFRVISDGKALQWPNGTSDSHGIEQAIRNAKTLSQFLADSAAEKVWVKPVLVLPGWLVIRKAAGPVNILNPKEIRGSFPREQVLTPEQIQRICHQLSEKCRLPGG